MVLIKQRVRRGQRLLMTAVVRAAKSLSMTSCRLHDIWKIFVQIAPHPMNFIPALFAWNAKCR